MSSLPMQGWLWPTLIVIGLVLVAVGAVALVRRGGSPVSAKGSTDRSATARELLDARYARGEIDAAEYQHRREQLR